MRKRPLCAGVVLLILLILICRYMGVQQKAPPALQDVGKQMLLTGHVLSVQDTEKQKKIIMKQISYLPDDEKQPYQMADVLKQLQSFQANLYFQNYPLFKKQFHTAQWKKPDRSDRVLFFVSADTENTISTGQIILVRGKAELADSATNPGQFDAREYDRRQSVLFRLTSPDICHVWNGACDAEQIMMLVRERLAATCEKIFSRKDAGIITAMLLGDRSLLEDSTKQLYQEGGIMHILAISSVHISLIGMTLYRLLRKFRRSFFVSGICSGMSVLIFCVMTGMSVSAVRAFVMFLIWTVGQILGRTDDKLTSTAAAAAVILLNDPECLWDSGFLLSFSCVLSIQLLMPAVEYLLPGRREIRKSLSGSLAVMTGTMPVTMYFFYQITPYGFLTNLLILPCVSLVMFCGLSGMITGMLLPEAGIFLAAPCHYLFSFFETVCKWEQKLPLSLLITGRPALRRVIIYYLLIAAAVFLVYKTTSADSAELKKRGRAGKVKRKLICCGLLAAAFLQLFWKQMPDMRVTFLDVGQGDCSIVECGSYVCLIDGGSSSVNEVWKYRIEQALRYYGHSKIDAVMVTHGDADHMNGIRQWIEGLNRTETEQSGACLTLKQLYLPYLQNADEKLEELAGLAETAGIAVARLRAGDRIVLKRSDSSEIIWECLHPRADAQTGEANEDSLVMLLKASQCSVLFAGDLEESGEEVFLERYREGAVTVLKTGHHGSKNGTSEAFLKQTAPRAAVISCGKNNRYGHPSEEVIERLTKHQIMIFRTDYHGAVTLTAEKSGAIYAEPR